MLAAVRSSAWRGTDGEDVVHGGVVGMWISGKGGEDRLFGGNSADCVWGGFEDDLLYGGAGNDFSSFFSLPEEFDLTLEHVHGPL
ncbi:MAG TPA: hypothetical protein VFI90_18155 [Rubrobacter sp.]|nr:hypothetical protein [Rubrobacter sp.]